MRMVKLFNYIADYSIIFRYVYSIKEKDIRKMGVKAIKKNMKDKKEIVYDESIWQDI